MVIVGLTGSIGMGKSAAAADFRRLCVPVHDADGAVHRLLDKDGEAVGAIRAAFPGVVKKGAVDREALARTVFGDPDALSALETMLHPLVRRLEDRFLRTAAMQGYSLVVLDIPLLFETGGESRCDAVVVTTAPRFLQVRRVLARPGMTAERLEQILSCQIPDAEKRRRADFIIANGLGRAFSLRAIEKIVKATSRRQGAKWPRPGKATIHARSRSRYGNNRS